MSTAAEGNAVSGPAGGEPRGELLERVLAALERGEELDPAELGAERERDPARLAALQRAVARYRALLGEARAARGSPALERGERVADFEVVELFATGGSGEVYRAKQLALGGRLVALKVLRAGTRSSVQLERFEREALVLASLHHPSLVEVHGFGRAGELCYLAMRLVPGRSLARFQEEHGAPFEPRRAVQWTLDVAAALEVVHAAGLVHRDVKPANIVVEEPGGRAVLVDFGLARPVNGWTKTHGGLPPMTTAYAAPEQLLGLEVDARADVFSLGVVLHELLSGARAGHEPPAAARTLAPPRAAGVDEGLRAIVAMATAERREDRYASGGELARDLTAWLAGSPVQARRFAARERLWRFVVRHRRSAVRLGARAVVAGALGALLLGANFLRARGQALRTAARELDLPSVEREFAALPGFLAPLLVREARALELARRLARPAEEEPLVRIAQRMAVGDGEGVLRLAAAHLGEVGLESDPELLEVLLAPLIRAPLDPAREAQAMALLALVAMVHPEPVSNLGPGSARVRDLARRLLEDPRRNGDARLEAVSLLGSTGGIDEGRVLAARLLSAPVASEELRLSCESLERIVRRSAEEPALARMLDSIPWAPVLAHIRAIRADGGRGSSWGTAAAFQRLLTAFHLARRRAGRATSADEALPEDWLVPGAESWLGLGQFEPALELAAAGDPRAMGVLRALDPETIHRWQAELLGRIAAFLGDAAWLEGAALERLVELGWEREAAHRELLHFQRAGKIELELGQTSADDFEDGLLPGAARAPVEARALELEEFPRWPGFDEVLVAVWSFSAGDAQMRMGAAQGAVGTEVELRREGGDPPSLLFRGAGSQVVLALAPCEGARPACTLRVQGQVSARRYLPYQGIVRLELELDGRRVGTQSLAHIGKGYEEFEIPASWLDGGAHVLTLRVGVESTTSYRLLQAVLARSDR